MWGHDLSGGDLQAPFAMLVAMIDRDPFLGRVATGRIAAGSAAVGDAVRVLNAQGMLRSGYFHVTMCHVMRAGSAADVAWHDMHQQMSPLQRTVSWQLGAAGCSHTCCHPLRPYAYRAGQAVQTAKLTKIWKRSGVSRAELTSAGAGGGFWQACRVKTLAAMVPHKSCVHAGHLACPACCGNATPCMPDKTPAARAGDIVSVTGCTEAAITHTIAHPSIEVPLSAGHIDPPTLR